MRGTLGAVPGKRRLRQHTWTPCPETARRGGCIIPAACTLSHWHPADRFEGHICLIAAPSPARPVLTPAAAQGSPWRDPRLMNYLWGAGRPPPTSPTSGGPPFRQCGGLARPGPDPQPADLEPTSLCSLAGTRTCSCSTAAPSGPRRRAGWCSTSRPPATTGWSTHGTTWACSSRWRHWMVSPQLPPPLVPVQPSAVDLGRMAAVPPLPSIEGRLPLLPAQSVKPSLLIPNGNQSLPLLHKTMTQWAGAGLEKALVLKGRPPPALGASPVRNAGFLAVPGLPLQTCTFTEPQRMPKRKHLRWACTAPHTQDTGHSGVFWALQRV